MRLNLLNLSTALPGAISAADKALDLTDAVLEVDSDRLEAVKRICLEVKTARTALRQLQETLSLPDLGASTPDRRAMVEVFNLVAAVGECVLGLDCVQSRLMLDYHFKWDSEDGERMNAGSGSGRSSAMGERDKKRWGLWAEGPHDKGIECNDRLESVLRALQEARTAVWLILTILQR